MPHSSLLLGAGLNDTGDSTAGHHENNKNHDNVQQQQHIDPLALPSPHSKQRFQQHNNNNSPPEILHWGTGRDENDPTESITPSQCTTATTTNSRLSLTAGAVANLCSATLGAGVLALPYALRQAGWFVGTVLLLGSALATVASIFLLIAAMDYYDCADVGYEGLAERVVGPKCRTAVEAALLLFCGGCAVAYTIAVGDILEQANVLLWHSRSGSMTVAFVTLMLPLSMLRYMKSLQVASSVGIAAIGTLAFAAGVHYWTKPNDPASEEPPMSDFWWPANGAVSVMTAAPVVLFAFSCQTNVCAIYNEMVVPPTISLTDIPMTKTQLMRQVTVTAVIICAFLYATVSVLALADFGTAVLPNMLSNYHNTNHAQQIMQVATAAMAFAVIMAFPLNIFPARVTLIGIVHKTKAARSQRSSRNPSNTTERPDDDEERNLTQALLRVDDDNDDDNQMEQSHDHHGAPEPEHHTMIPLQVQQERGTTTPSSFTGINSNADDESDENFDWRLHIVTTLFLTGTTLGLALVVPNISVVFGLLGGTASSMIGFCVPGLLGLQLSRDMYEDTGQRQLGTLVVSWLLLLGGTLAAIVTTGVTAYNIFWVPSSR